MNALLRGARCHLGGGSLDGMVSILRTRGTKQVPPACIQFKAGRKQKIAYPKSVGSRLSVRRELSTSHLNFMLHMSHCENKGGRVTIGEITQVFSQQMHGSLFQPHLSIVPYHHDAEGAE